MVEVCPLGRRRFVAPRIKPLDARLWVPSGRLLPLFFCREAFTGPPGVRVGLVPRDVHDRRRGVQRLVETEALRPPAVQFGLVPVLWRGYALLFDVFPTPFFPELLFLVSSGLDELHEGLVGDGGFVYKEVREVHDVRFALVVQGPSTVFGAHYKLTGRDGDHLPFDRVARRQFDLWLGFVAFAFFELEGLEHRLVMLSFVLDDHVVDEAVFEEFVIAVEVRVFKGFEDRFAHGVQVEVRVFAVEQVQGGALFAWVQRGVVHVVELPLGENLAVRLLHEPQLLVVPDVAVVPHQGAHYGIVLPHEVLFGDLFEQEARPLPPFLQPLDDGVLDRFALCIHSVDGNAFLTTGAAGKGLPMTPVLVLCCRWWVRSPEGFQRSRRRLRFMKWVREKSLERRVSSRRLSSLASSFLLITDGSC